MPWQGLSNVSISSLNRFVKSRIQNVEKYSLRFKRSGKVHNRLTHDETKILVEMSQLLSETFTTSNKLVQRFHWIVKGLVMTVGSPTWKEAANISWFRRTRKQATSMKSSNDVNSTDGTCKDMRHDADHKPSSTKRSDNCFGMCGMYCWCWSWVCGDCCLHKGCFQHDSCCQRGGYISVYCLCPWVFGFNCQNGYNGYPDCMYL